MFGKRSEAILAAFGELNGVAQYQLHDDDAIGHWNCRAFEHI